VHEAEASKRPDWSVELAYQRRGPTFGDMVSVQFRFDLPIFSGQRQDPRIAAKRAERDTLDAERAALLEQHEQELSSDWADLERLDKALERNRSVLQPLAHEKIELAMAAYSSGKATLSEVIAARREWFELQLKEAAIAGERALIAMRLHYAVADPMSPGAAQ
jgi:outer membrane protein TolC